MERLRTTYRDDEDDDSDPSGAHLQYRLLKRENPYPIAANGRSDSSNHSENGSKQDEFEEAEDNGNNDEEEEEDGDYAFEEEDEHKLGKPQIIATQLPSSSETDEDYTPDGVGGQPRKKQKPLSSFNSLSPSPASPAVAELASAGMDVVSLKKPKKKSKAINVWTKSTSRKGKKKPKPSPASNPESSVLITPVPRFPDRSDDSPEMRICLSKVYKAEKVELSEDRMSAGSTKGYRMVRATRGVVEGAWYFEIRVESLGETGHTRLGWSTDKGDLQAPVGYDGNSFGYRDVDGSKVHRALREKYGETGYVEGDVVGLYISLPEGSLYEPKPLHFGWYRGQKYAYTADGKEDPPKVVPGSEISFFKNGVCQGVAFRDLYGGRYYPAASMYTLPDQPNCVVKFNFGPDFDFFPEDFDGRPIPRPMIEVPFHGYDSRIGGIMQNVLSDETKNQLLEMA